MTRGAPARAPLVSLMASAQGRSRSPRVFWDQHGVYGWTKPARGRLSRGVSPFYKPAPSLERGLIKARSSTIFMTVRPLSNVLEPSGYPPPQASHLSPSSIARPEHKAEHPQPSSPAAISILARPLAPVAPAGVPATMTLASPILGLSSLAPLTAMPRMDCAERTLASASGGGRSG
jgi:hypothetical protein